jgi:septal ring factor EnvC (AmiA/AmiB activator)
VIEVSEADVVKDMEAEAPYLSKRKQAVQTVYFPSEEMMRRLKQAEDDIQHYSRIIYLIEQENQELMHEIDRFTIMQRSLLNPYSAELAKAEEKIEQINMVLRSQITSSSVQTDAMDREINTLTKAFDLLKRQDLKFKSGPSMVNGLDFISTVLDYLQEQKPVAEKIFEQKKEQLIQPPQPKEPEKKPEKPKQGEEEV